MKIDYKKVYSPSGTVYDQTVTLTVEVLDAINEEVTEATIGKDKPYLFGVEYRSYVKPVSLGTNYLTLTMARLVHSVLIDTGVDLKRYKLDRNTRLIIK